MNKKKLTIIAGPTAVGKTEYAINYALENNGEIISLDAVQIYKDLNIGSAKPSIEEMSRVPHYMVDILDPSVNINVKEFKDMAVKYIDDIHSRGKLPLLVGGSGFYINAILFDTDFLYEDDNEVKRLRQKYEKELSNNGIDYLYSRLKEVDPNAIEYIPKENVRRVIRALEFYELHNMPISKYNETERLKESPYEYNYFVLNMDRDRLYSRINKRVDKMIENGLLKEVKSLINKGYGKDLNSMNSIGYNELYDYVKEREEISDISTLDDESMRDLKNIIDEIKKHSRNYAKRQLTWFRSQKNVTWIEI